MMTQHMEITGTVTLKCSDCGCASIEVPIEEVAFDNIESEVEDEVDCEGWRGSLCPSCERADQVAARADYEIKYRKEEGAL